MAFSDNFPGVYSRIFTQLYPLGTYTPTVGDAVSCRVGIKHNVAIQPDGYESTVVELATIASALVSDVGSPAKGATFLVDSTIYTVVKIAENDGVTVKLVVK